MRITYMQKGSSEEERRGQRRQPVEQSVGQTVDEPDRDHSRYYGKSARHDKKRRHPDGGILVHVELQSICAAEVPDFPADAINRGHDVELERWPMEEVRVHPGVEQTDSRDNDRGFIGARFGVRNTERHTPHAKQRADQQDRRENQPLTSAHVRKEQRGEERLRDTEDRVPGISRTERSYLGAAAAVTLM